VKKNLLFFFVVLSFLVHLLFFSNIRYSIQQPDPVESLKIDLLPTFDKISEKKSAKKTEFKTKESLQSVEKKSPTSALQDKVIEKKPDIQINKKKEVLPAPLCELCQPVEDISVPDEPPAYGEAIKDIQFKFKVLYELGPNKSSLDKINPLGQTSVEKKNKEIQRVSEIGFLTIHYSIEGNKYQINYHANATGFTSLIYSDGLIQKSQGTIKEDGLRPDYYLYQYGKKKRNEAFFDWQNKRLRLLKNKEEKFFDLIDGAQDQLSIFFQFMFLNPLEKMQIPITNAKLFKTYNYQYVDEGILNTPIGDIEYLHIAKFNYEEPERIDAWLAKNYGFLPIKISFTQDDLSVILHKIEALEIKNN
jgi:hypothetical protein